MTKTTKELARELGFLCKRSTSQQRRHEIQKKARQLFSYLIVLDFESTCWKEERGRCQEIIEFPAVLLNTHNGQIVSEFHFYVQPVENPVLSDFCSELTGIKQEQVNQGIPLSICLKKFERWLKEISEKHNFVYNREVAEVQPKCTFVTWSDWDLGVCLHYETRRKQLRKPPELNSWIDLRATYRSFYQRKPKGLNGALQDLGLTFEGREHSGIIDARNTARLAYRMICDGCVLDITKTMAGCVSSCAVGALAVQDQPSEVQQVKGHSPTGKDGLETVQNGLLVTSPSYLDAENTKQTLDSAKVETSCDENSAQYVHEKPEDVISSAGSKGRTNEKPTNQEPFSTLPNQKRPFNPGTSEPETVSEKRNKPQPLGSVTTGKVNRERTGLADITNVRLNVAGERQSPSEGKRSSDRPGSSAKPSVSHDPECLASGEASRPASFRTPFFVDSSRKAASMKRTPPLCGCGNRAKRRTVQKPGPNFGRVFFCCGSNRKVKTGGGGGGGGCGFFLWERCPSAAVGASPVLATREKKPAVQPGRLQESVVMLIRQPDFSTPRSLDGSKTRFR